MSPILDFLGSVRGRGMLVLVAVALAAGVVGAAIDRMWVARLFMLSVRESRDGGSLVEARSLPRETPASEKNADIPYALRRVDLSDAQREQIRAIASKYRPSADSLLRVVRPRIFALDLRMREEAMCVLTPAQRDAWVADRRARGLNMAEGEQMLQLVTSNSCPK